MARKQQENIRIDQRLLAEFEKIANRKKQPHNAEIEELMKQYMARAEKFSQLMRGLL